MKIETGHEMLGNVTTVDAKAVRFVTEDGRTMFEVIICEDGASIEVRAPEVFCKVNCKLYNNRLQIEPRVSNQITVRCALYDE